MSLASLKNELRTGIDSLDHEHRKLVGVMEALCDSFESTPFAGAVSNGFGMLYEQASARFALEERLMRAHDCTFYDTHKTDHERLLEQIRSMMEAYEEGKCEDCGTSLRACLETWLTDHVRNADAALCILAE